jgi:hypothetical protein
MKYMKIENNRGSYWDGKEYQEIDKINKDSLLVLLNMAETNDFELDAYDENLLGNKAHQIIYENIYSKLKQFLNDKNQFKTEVSNLYKESIDKYSTNIQNECFDDVDDSENEDNTTSEDIPF